MNKLTQWRLAKKLMASERRGVVIGLTIAALVCILVAVCIIKFRWLKKLGWFGNGLGSGEVAGCDDDGCCFTSDKDFV